MSCGALQSRAQEGDDGVGCHLAQRHGELAHVGALVTLLRMSTLQGGSEITSLACLLPFRWRSLQGRRFDKRL